MKKGRGISVHIHFTNRWLYTLIALGILAVIGIGVYALSPGVTPNPGHALSQISPPSGCQANQNIIWNGTDLTCSSAPATWIPSSIKQTTSTHNAGFVGSFGSPEGYYAMYNWIQTHGCEGYHICSLNEYLAYSQVNNVGGMFSSSAWIATGVSTNADCNQWVSTSSSQNTIVAWFTTQYSSVLTTATCNQNLPVLCCK